MNEKQIQRPKCPECGHTMAKNGFRWCGRHRKQKYQCSQCGRSIERPIETKDKPG